MNREKLREYLHNGPLVQAIEHKRAIDNTKKHLREALIVMQGTGISREALSEVSKEIETYKKISLNYGSLLEDTWGVTWQNESIICKYIGYLDDDIDRLPETIKLP